MFLFVVEGHLALCSQEHPRRRETLPGLRARAPCSSQRLLPEGGPAHTTPAQYREPMRIYTALYCIHAVPSQFAEPGSRCRSRGNDTLAKIPWAHASAVSRETVHNNHIRQQVGIRGHTNLGNDNGASATADDAGITRKDFATLQGTSTETYDFPLFGFGWAS